MGGESVPLSLSLFFFLLLGWSHKNMSGKGRKEERRRVLHHFHTWAKWLPSLPPFPTLLLRHA